MDTRTSAIGTPSPRRSRFFATQNDAVVVAPCTGEAEHCDLSRSQVCTHNHRSDHSPKIPDKEHVCTRKRFRIWGKRSPDLKRHARKQTLLDSGQKDNSHASKNLGHMMRQVPIHANESWEDAVQRLSNRHMSKEFPGYEAMSRSGQRKCAQTVEKQMSTKHRARKLVVKESDAASSTMKMEVFTNGTGGSHTSLAIAFSEFCTMSASIIKGQHQQRIEAAETLFEACLSMSAPSAVGQAAIQVLAVETKRVLRSLVCSHSGSRFEALKSRLDMLQEKLRVHAHVVYGIAAHSGKQRNGLKSRSNKHNDYAAIPTVDAAANAVKMEDGSAHHTTESSSQKCIKRRDSDIDSSTIDCSAAIRGESERKTRVKRCKSDPDPVEHVTRQVTLKHPTLDGNTSVKTEAVGYNGKRMWSAGQVRSRHAVVDLDVTVETHASTMRHASDESAQSRSHLLQHLDAPKVTCRENAGTSESSQPNDCVHEACFSLGCALENFRKVVRCDAHYKVRAEATQKLIEECLAIRSALEDGALILREVWKELQRQVINISCRIYDKKDMLDRVHFRKQLVDMRRRLREHARTIYKLEFDVTSAKFSVEANIGSEAEEAPASLEELSRRCPIYCATADCRHLCSSLCYFREYEPCRQLHTLQRRACTHPLRPDVDGWTARVALSSRPPFWCTVVHDVTGAVCGSPEEAWQVAIDRALSAPLPTPAVKEEVLDSAASLQLPHEDSQVLDSAASLQLPHEDSQVDKFSALPIVRSPFGLIEDLFAEKPWQLLVACILLNRTPRILTDRVLFAVFRRWPSAEALREADHSELETLLAPLGLQRKRSSMLKRFSDEYLAAIAEAGSPLPAKRLASLHGIGRYARDAYAIYLRRELVTPTDIYLGWAVEHFRKVRATCSLCEQEAKTLHLAR